MKVERTDYLVQGYPEPCFEISNNDVLVRIATCYHYIGSNTLYVTEYINGELNSEEEIKGDFEALTEKDAKRIALENSVYLK